jgi:hypothetical protein
LPHVLTYFDFSRENGRFDECAETRHHFWGDGVVGVPNVLFCVTRVLEDQVEATVVATRGQPVGCELLRADLDVYADSLEDVVFCV